MHKKEIQDRADVFLLVSTFYEKIKRDETIGEFFTKTIPESEWDDHIEKLTDFWETNLFFVRKFKGNPIKAHRDVDRNFNFKIGQEHFGQWLFLWFFTIDELFIGEKANQAKERARNIASMLFFKLYDAKLK
ncbi:group III truncated hemoglobin [Tenacibaculum amylolyticum]|uniref:group III truncated hemoglobin n=1 Tax=Tenacibaculum amylolyticum TaxID=104269 RepID=UPI003894DD28